MESEFNREAHVFRSPNVIKVITEAIVFLLKSPVYNLPPAAQFSGAGVYAIYYDGAFEPYVGLIKANQGEYNRPIYVGKAVPPGWRQGRNAETDTPALYNRLKEHTRSIESAKNLALSDFKCRFMLLEGQESNLISTIEAELIRKFKPLWNSLIDGFGNHDPGSGRYNQSPSEWDILHPGRAWSRRLTGKAVSVDEIVAKIRQTISSS